MSQNMRPMEKIKKQVQNAIHLYQVQNIPALQQQLYELFLNFNKFGGGKYILSYPNKDELAECFTLMLRYDWMHDSDIREVWAENGFYCLIDYLTSPAKSPLERSTAGLDLFIHLCEAKEALLPKIQNILNKAIIVHNPIFRDHFIYNNANRLIEQFLYLSAMLVKPLLLVNPNFLSNNYRKTYDEIISNTQIETQSSPHHILEKAKFISRVIEAVLTDM